MKCLRKLVVVMILAMGFALTLTSCAEQIQLETNLTINDDFSGTRVIVADITKSSFASNAHKSISEVTKLIKEDCPPEMDFEFKEEGEIYRCIFTLNFKDREEYIEKVSAILNKDVNVQMSLPNSVFSSGLLFEESFSSGQMMSWLSTTLRENKVTSSTDLFSDNGVVATIRGKEYNLNTSRVSVSDITYTRVSAVEISTDVLSANMVNRTIKIIIPKEEWDSKKEAIEEYTVGKVPKQCTYEVEENEWGAWIIYSMEDVTLNELEENMKVILNSDAYSIEGITATVVSSDKQETEEESIGEEVEYVRPFDIKKGYTEYLDLSSYASSNDGTVVLNYLVRRSEDGYQNIQEFSNGVFNDLWTYAYDSPDYLMAQFKKYKATQIKVESETDYIAANIDIITELGGNSKVAKTVVLAIIPQPNKADKETILENLKTYSGDSAKIDYNEDETQGIITIKFSGSVVDVNEIMAGLFGPGNEIEYYKETGFFKFHKDGVFNETINMSDFITCDISNINYEAKTGAGEKISKGMEYENAEISKASYNATVLAYEGLNVSFTTSSFNYPLLILILLLLAGVIAAVIIFGIRKTDAFKGINLKAVDLGKVKALFAGAIAFTKDKTAKIKNSDGVKNGISNMDEPMTKEPASDEREKKIRIGLKIFAIIAGICFFIPLCSVSCQMGSVNLTGPRLAFGFELFGQNVDGNLIALLLLIFPIIMAVLLFVKKMQKGFISDAAIGLMSIINLGVLLMIHSRIITSAAEFMLKADFKFGYYLANISYIALLIGSGVLVWFKIKKPVAEAYVESVESEAAESVESEAAESVETEVAPSEELLE